MAIDHLMIDFEAAIGWVQVEEAPSDLAFGETFVHRMCLATRNSNATSLVLIKLSRCVSTPQESHSYSLVLPQPP